MKVAKANTVATEVQVVSLFGIIISSEARPSHLPRVRAKERYAAIA